MPGYKLVWYDHPDMPSDNENLDILGYRMVQSDHPSN